MKKYGYFGEGLEGYMHYMQSFEENFSSDKNDYSDNSFDSDYDYDDSDDYNLFDDNNDEDSDFDDEEDEEELPTMTIDGHITLGPDESEIDFLLKFEDFLEENGWSFDGLTMDD